MANNLMLWSHCAPLLSWRPILQWLNIFVHFTSKPCGQPSQAVRLRVKYNKKMHRQQHLPRVLSLGRWGTLRVLLFRPPSEGNYKSNKLYNANTALKFSIKKSVMITVIQDSLTRQQFSMIISSLYQISNTTTTPYCYHCRGPAKEQ